MINGFQIGFARYLTSAPIYLVQNNSYIINTPTPLATNVKELLASKYSNIATENTEYKKPKRITGHRGLSTSLQLEASINEPKKTENNIEKT